MRTKNLHTTFHFIGGHRGNEPKPNRNLRRKHSGYETQTTSVWVLGTVRTKTMDPQEWIAETAL